MAEATVAAAPGRTFGDVPVALLLAAAAVVAAAIGARAALLAGDAGDAWQSAVREQVRHGAFVVNDSLLLYGNDLPQVTELARTTALARAYAAEAQKLASTDPQAALGLALEAQLQAASRTSVLGAMRAVIPYVGDDRFRIEQRRADLNRASLAGAADPVAVQRRGDRLGRRAALETAATIPAAVAFLLGSLARAFPRRRRPFVYAGGALLAACIALALALEAAA